MEISGFFNSVNGDRRYKAEDFADYFAAFIANGIFPNPSTGLQVITKENMTVTVKMGRAWINGYEYKNTSDLDKELDIADGVLNRIDRIVIRWINSERTVYCVIKKGTFASSPVAPALQRDVDAYELALADIKVKAGATEIRQEDITDLRLDTSLCGIVHGVVEQADTSTIFNQYMAWLTTIQQGWGEWTEAEKEAWYAWWADQHDTSAYVTANNIYTYFTPIVQQIGNGTDKEFTITHNFTGMQYPDVKMVVTETGEEVIPDNTYLSETAVKVSFDEYTPAENEFTVIVRR